MSDWLPPTIETKRLILRDLKLEDAGDIFAYASDPDVSKYTMWEPHLKIEDTTSYIRDYAFEYYKKEIPEPFAIVKKSTNRVVGTVGCFWVSEKSKCMELAYALAPEYWGEGFIVEASKSVIDYCFKEYALERLQCRCKSQNLASERVMQKLGMTYEGTLRKSLKHRDEFFDMKYYSLLRD